MFSSKCFQIFCVSEILFICWYIFERSAVKVYLYFRNHRMVYMALCTTCPICNTSLRDKPVSIWFLCWRRIRRDTSLFNLKVVELHDELKNVFLQRQSHQFHGNVQGVYILASIQCIVFFRSASSINRFSKNFKSSSCFTLVFNGNLTIERPVWSRHGVDW